MNQSKLTLILVALVIILGSGNILFYHKYQKAVSNNPQTQTQQLINEIAKTTTLPDETPSVVTVVDKTKLSNPSLARGTENGDKILIFANASKVVVYRPSTHKLINIFSLAAKAAAQSTQPSAASKATTTKPNR